MNRSLNRKHLSVSMLRNFIPCCLMLSMFLPVEGPCIHWQWTLERYSKINYFVGIIVPGRSLHSDILLCNTRIQIKSRDDPALIHLSWLFPCFIICNVLFLSALHWSSIYLSVDTWCFQHSANRSTFYPYYTFCLYSKLIWTWNFLNTLRQTVCE